MTFDEAKSALATKLNISYSDIANNGRFTDSDLGLWVNLACLQVWDLHPWDFTEIVKTITLTSDDITNGYINYPTDVVSGSAQFVRVDSKMWVKRGYRSYLTTLENNTSATDKIWSEMGRLIFFNTNATAAAGVLDLFGKKRFAKLSNTSDLLPFSPDTDDNEYSGNQAVIRLAFAEALGSEKMQNPNQANTERQTALQILELLWKEFAQNRALDQQKDVPIFDVPDFFQGRSGSGNVPGTF